jgi:hypothetical protein
MEPELLYAKTFPRVGATKHTKTDPLAPKQEWSRIQVLCLPLKITQNHPKRLATTLEWCSLQRLALAQRTRRNAHLYLFHANVGTRFRSAAWIWWAQYGTTTLSPPIEFSEQVALRRKTTAMYSQKVRLHCILEHRTAPIKLPTKWSGLIGPKNTSGIFEILRSQNSECVPDPFAPGVGGGREQRRLADLGHFRRDEERDVVLAARAQHLFPSEAASKLRGGRAGTVQD